MTESRRTLPAPQVVLRHPVFGLPQFAGATVMRCYYVRGGHFVDVDEVSGPSDEDAIGKAQALFSEREDLFEGFELWDCTRMLIGHPQLSAPNNAAVWPLHIA